MADAPAFDYVCEELEQRSSLDRLEARGTVRIALKQAGLEARSIAPAQMKVVLDRVMPDELRSRGIEDAESLCGAISRGLGSIDAGETAESPDAVFARLGGESA